MLMTGERKWAGVTAAFAKPIGGRFSCVWPIVCADEKCEAGKGGNVGDGRPLESGDGVAHAEAGARGIASLKGA